MCKAFHGSRTLLEGIIYIYVQGVSRVQDITGGNYLYLCARRFTGPGHYWREYLLDLGDQKKVTINVGFILKYYRVLAVF